MKEILEEIREAYLRRVSKYKIGEKYRVVKDSFGLCYTANKLGKLKEFQEYTEQAKKNQKVFYTCWGDKTSNRTQFMWHPSNIQSRLNWLDKQIAKLEK